MPGKVTKHPAESMGRGTRNEGAVNNIMDIIFVHGMVGMYHGDISQFGEGFAKHTQRKFCLGVNDVQFETCNFCQHMRWISQPHPILLDKHAGHAGHMDHPRVRIVHMGIGRGENIDRMSQSTQLGGEGGRGGGNAVKLREISVCKKADIHEENSFCPPA